MNERERLDYSKRRALAYLDAGQPAQEALTSLFSDMNQVSGYKEMIQLGFQMMMQGALDMPEAARRFIEVFCGAEAEFTCYYCGETFVKGVSDEESLAAGESFFGPLPEEARALVCDDCWNKIRPDRN